VGHVRDVAVKWVMLRMLQWSGSCYRCCNEVGHVRDVAVKWVMLGMLQWSGSC